jgi:hypothetical protein
MPQGQTKQTFSCKEKSCGEQVEYTRITVSGDYLERAEGMREDVVYLTCPRNHTHSYTVKR